MFKSFQILTVCFSALATFGPGIVFCKYEDQPKITFKNSDLVLEAAYDRNITLRLTGDSSLFLNDVNLMEKIRQHFAPAVEDSDSSKQTEAISTDAIKTEVQRLHGDLERFALRLMTMQNRTRRTLQLGVIRRHLGRINRLNGRLLALERKLKKDECAEAADPCKNGGTCYDSYNGFHCECTEGYTGKTCADDVDECYLLSGTDLGCQNNAVCINTPGSYKCNCAKGFSGTHCRLRNVVCHQAPLQELCGHGTCVPANNQQGYTCICEQGWTRNTASPTNGTALATLACDIDVNECEESSNPCHSDCINLPGSFKCGPCPAGYTGNGAVCLDIDECATSNGGCSTLPKVRCINTEGSYFCGNCPPGWVGDGHTCELAPSNSCDEEKICHPQAKCEYISDVASCTCPVGMFGHGFGPKGCHANPITDSCDNHICQNNGTCVSSGRTTSCICPNGYSGALCESADGCHPSPCQNDGTCKPLGVKGFKCSCLPGTTGKFCEVLRSVCAKSLRLPAGELKYPTSDEKEYSINEKCAWIIRTTPTQILNVTFSKFDVEESEDCTHDWLQIHDGNSLASQLIGRFCGKDLPLGGNILSSHHLLFFWFRSDNTTNRSGFEMSWVSQPHVCGGDLELSHKDAGVIKSPGYPGRTPINRDCQWQLSAPFGYRFTIRVYDINLGFLPNCIGDFLLVNDADLMLKKYCQSTTSEVLHSSSNRISVYLHTDRFSVDSSFQLHYEVEPGLPHCGGIFTESVGYIIGPSQQATCLYLIQQPRGTQIRWEFVDFESFEATNCNLNKIEIFDGETDEDPVILSTCGGETPDPVTSSQNYLLLRYKNSFADETKSSKPIKAKYSRVCDVRVFGPDAGVLTTPNYPKPYTQRITCTFHIYGPAETVVVANFTDFNIAETVFSDGEDAIIDNVTSSNSLTASAKLRDESITYVDIFLSSTNKRRFHKGAPMVIRSERNVMTVVFHATTNRVNARGLRIEYSFENIECGGVYTENRGSLEKSVDGAECVVIFEAPEGKHIKLDLDYSVLGETGEFLIYANQTRGGDFLLKNATVSSKIVETFNFNTITLVLKFRMKISGFYEFVNTAQACGGNFSSLYGAITSPSWPRPYQPNLNCVWRITAPLGNKIELQIHNFTLESTCSGDKLEIRNGKFPSSPLIGRYCGSQIPSRLVSFANSLYIRFTTDNYIEGSGFYMNWEQTMTGCGGKLTAYKGSIHTPHLDLLPETLAMQNVNMICDWQIVVSQGSSIDLKVTTAVDELEFCHKNNLKFYDGSSTLSPLLRFNCTSLMKGAHLELKASSNKLLIVYSLSENSKFVAPEYIIDYVTNCKVVIENHHGVIESPNFPEDYPENQNCAWDLRAGGNNKVKLVFSHLSLEVLDMLCEHDYVEVWDMKDMDVLKKHHLCFQTSEPIVSGGNRLVVHFVTDYSNNKNGFRAEYNRQGCGEHLMKEFDYVSSPNPPYSNDLDCDWLIEVEPGKQIVFMVTDFHIETENPDCSQNIFYIKESKNSSIELARECHEQQTPLIVTSPGNLLYVHFHTSPTRSRKYFKAFYHSKSAACGGTLKGTSGLINSLNYPYPPITQSYNCVWDITVPESYGILLNFKHFQLRESPNCTEASIVFYKITGASTLFLDKFCGAEKPNIKLVHSNHLRVEYKDSGKQNAGIFSIEFRKQCGGLITQSFGYIKALATEECVWEMDAEPGTLIALTILQMDCYCRKNDAGLKDCAKGLGFKENNFDEDLQSGNYTLYMCEDHQTDLIFETAKLHIFAKNINFKAKYTTTQHSCGGLIESARGSLASPHYPSTYPANTECTWMLQGTKGSFLELQFNQFDIVQSEYCNEDYLEVRKWSEGPIIGIFCGSKIPQQTLVSYERFWLKFHSAEGNTGKGFKISWNYAHLNEITNKTKGYISNPPLNMVRNDEAPYAWRILVPRGLFIQLNFDEYNTGLNLFDGFDHTALPVDIGPSPWRFVSSSSVVFVQTDNENIDKFTLLWNTTTNKPMAANATISKCHSEEFINVHRFNAIRVFSPGYPSGYESTLNCDWVFKPANAIEHVAVALLEVDLESTVDCSADFLKISTSTDLLTWHKQEQLCNASNARKWGKETPFLWVHGTPHIKLDFVTDWSVNRTGFMAKVVAKCGSNMTDSVGFIDGAMFHSFNDGPNSQCVWHVNVKPGKRVRVRLDYPNMLFNKNDFDDECSNHALLYDGIDDHAPLIMPGKLCFPQNVSTISMNSTGSHLTIKYTLNLSKISPRLMNLKFWNLTYRAYSDCNEEIRLIPEAAEVIVTSPSYPNVPQPHTECEWRIMAPQGEIIQIEFKDRFDMNSRFCTQEYVELYDGSTPLSPKIGRYCRKPSTLRTTQNMLYMHYLTDIAEPRNGFQAVVSISRCGGSFSENYGTIKSPGYPASYPSNTQCDFVINLKNKNLIRLNFDDIDLPFNETKLQASDYLEIITLSDGGSMTFPSIFVYGNATKNTAIQIISSKAIIRFHTFLKSLSYRGFKLSYNSVGSYCSQSVTGIAGRVNLNLLMKSFYMNTCTLRITVPKGQRVRLELLNMDDLKGYNFTYPISFHVYHNFEWSSEITTFTPDTFDPQSAIQSSDNLIYMKVTLPKSDLLLRPLRVRYSSDAESPCPDDIGEDDKSGSIDIPGLDPAFNKSFYCGIKIKLKEEETIVFNISSFSVVGYGSMGISPLTFRDSYANTYYRKNLTDYIHAQSNKIGSVSIVQTNSDRVQRLKMAYQKFSCGGIIRVASGAEIKYPQVNSIEIGGEIMCVWSLLRPFMFSMDSAKGRDFKLVGNFTFAESCGKEYIEVVEGQWTNRTSAMKICREKMVDNFDFSLTKYTTYLIYRSLHYNMEKSAFAIHIEKTMACSSETLVTPMIASIKIDEKSYKNNLQCSWIFYAETSLYLQVKFIGRFFIEDSANCSKDYLEIQRDNKGVWEPEARFCGRETPGLFNSSSSRIQIVFRTDEAVTTEGFEFSVNTHCSRVINVTSTEVQTILSPRSSPQLWRKLHCEFIFQGNETDKIIFVRAKFDRSSQLYVRDACRLRSLTVNKRDVNGVDLPGDLHCELEFEARAEKYYPYLRFTFDAYRGQKFALEYAYDLCGGNLTKPSVIRHLKHKTENTYAENMNCIWYITAPPDHSIAVQFKYFSTEKTHDVLTIYRGLVAKRDKIVARLSGNFTSTAPIVVDNNQALINAVSDDTGFEKGFEANIIFLANCNERISLTEGNSPVALTRNIKFNSSEQYICNYRITAPKSYRVRVEIKKLQINRANSTCQLATANCELDCNYLQIYDNPSKFENAFAQFCASSSINRTFLSFYESARLRLDARQPGQYSFEMLLKIEKTECGLSEYKLGDNEIFKFSFPFNGLTKYAPNIHCTWRFIASSNLEFHFNYLDLQNKSQVNDRCVDYISIRDQSYVTHLCGRSENFTITEMTRFNKDVLVTFHSDESEEGKGFEFVTQRADACNRTYTLLSKSINYNGYQRENPVCNDTIVVPESYTLNFYIDTLYFRNADCEKLHLKITDLKTNETLLNRCYRTYTLVNLFTSTNAVRIEAAEFNSIRLLYSASKRDLPPGCGGVFRTNSGQFSSPPYQNDRNFSECRWDIIMPTTSETTLQFSDFNMGTMTNCNLDNVKLIEVLPNNTEKLLKTFCGSNMPKAVTSTSGHLAVVSKKSPNFDGIGWTLDYNSINFISEPNVFINNN